MPARCSLSPALRDLPQSLTLCQLATGSVTVALLDTQGRLAAQTNNSLDPACIDVHYG